MKQIFIIRNTAKELAEIVEASRLLTYNKYKDWFHDGNPPVSRNKKQHKKK